MSTYTQDLRDLVDETVVLGISKRTIADRAGYSHSRFIRWTNAPSMGLTMHTAAKIKDACIELTSEHTATSQKTNT